jgi:hypothetical protein
LSRFRLLLAISVLVALATALVACGDDDDGGAADENPQTVINQTFSGDNEKVESGNLSLTLDVDVSGDEDASVDAELSGPFENQGEGEVPKFALTANASGSGGGDDFSFDGALTSTGDAAYVNYKDTDYEVPQSLFDRFAAQIESASGQQGQDDQQSAQQLLDALGIEEPTELLTNLTNEGTEDVEGTETVHVSGDLDVDKLVDSVKGLIGNASLLGQLGGDTSQLPDPDQLDVVKDAVKEAHFDLYSGVDDHILRRLGVTLSIEAEGDSADIGFDLTLSDVNEPQTIEAPANPQPLRSLLGDLGVPAQALDQLGGLGGSDGSAAPTVPTTPDADAAQRYLNCIAQANTAADLQQCQSLAP